MISRLVWPALLLINATLFGHDGPETLRTGRAFLYSEPDFRGECLVVESDTEISDLAKVRDSRGRKWDDRIASVRFEGPVRIILFADPRFRGETLMVQRPINDLARVRHGETGIENWDRRVSALKVESFFEGVRDKFHFRNSSEADRAIIAAYRDILGRDPDRAGLEHARYCLLEKGWDDQDLRNSLFDSREFRERDVQAIVRRCYREILRRDPDPSGLNTYTRAMREKRWTEKELRAALSRGDEARDFAAHEIVVRAYRDVLGREPDRDGLANYVKLVREGMTEQRLREIFRQSDEYRKKPGRK